MLKPVLRFLFVSGGREGVENETNVIRFASFCELLFATAPYIVEAQLRFFFTMFSFCSGSLTRIGAYQVSPVLE